MSRSVFPPCVSMHGIIFTLFSCLGTPRTPGLRSKYWPMSTARTGLIREHIGASHSQRRPKAALPRRPCHILDLPEQLLASVLRRTCMADVIAFGVCLPSASSSALAAVADALQRQDVSAASLLLGALAASCYPQVCGPTLSAFFLSDDCYLRIAMHLTCPVESPPPLPLALKTKCRTCIAREVLDAAERINIDHVFVQEVFCALAQHMPFAEFGECAAAVHDIALRAAIYRRIIRRCRHGPRSAAANVLAACEHDPHDAATATQAHVRNNAFVATMARDWDAARKREFYEVVRAAQAEPLRFAALLHQ